MFYTGVDLHRRLIVLTTVDEKGAVVAKARMRTEPERIIEYFSQWTDPQRAVVECTGSWYWFCDLLKRNGITILLAHAKYLKEISYAKIKTDAVDSETLAQLLRMGYIPEAYQQSSDYRSLRDLLRQRMVMKLKRTNIIRRTASIPA